MTEQPRWFLRTCRSFLPKRLFQPNYYTYGNGHSKFLSLPPFQSCFVGLTILGDKSGSARADRSRLSEEHTLSFRLAILDQDFPLLRSTVFFSLRRLKADRLSCGKTLFIESADNNFIRHPTRFCLPVPSFRNVGFGRNHQKTSNCPLGDVAFQSSEASTLPHTRVITHHDKLAKVEHLLVVGRPEPEPETPVVVTHRFPVLRTEFPRIIHVGTNRRLSAERIIFNVGENALSVTAQVGNQYRKARGQLLCQFVSILFLTVFLV